MKKLTKLKAEMALRDVTSLKLSKDVGINHCVFSLYLNGWRRMPDKIRRKVSRYLKVGLKELFDNT